MADIYNPQLKKDMKYTICPRCGGSGKEMVFGYLQHDAQVIPKQVTCRVCNGSGKIIVKVKRFR